MSSAVECCRGRSESFETVGTRGRRTTVLSEQVQRQGRSMSVQGYVGYVAGGVLICAIFVGWSMYLRAEDEQFRSTAIRAEAKVVAHADQRSRDSSGDDSIDKFDV